MKSNGGKENGGPRRTRRNLSALRGDLEVDREAREQVATQRVVHLREGVTVAEAGRNHLRTGNRRIGVEDVVRTNAQVEALSQAGGERQVEILPSAQAILHPDGGLWIAWPKKSSGVRTDMTEDYIREIALPRDLVDNKVCAIDATWSGLRVVVPVAKRAGIERV